MKTSEQIGYQYHNCDGLNVDGVEVVYGDFHGAGDPKQWWLHLYREADDKDLMDGEADYVGELLCSNSIAISFCPYCGVKLKEAS